MLGPRKNQLCDDVKARLENAASHSIAPVSFEDLVSELPEADGSHLRDCADCRVAAEDIVATDRTLSALRRSRIEPSPFFAKRVMAAIESMEGERRAAGKTWVLFPRFASRLAAIACLALLVAGTWLYEAPHRQTETIARAQFVAGGVFEDLGTPQATPEDVLSTTPEAGR